MEVSKSCAGFLLLLAVLVAFMASPSHGYVFYVGGRDGWVVSPSESYSHWAGRNRFQINDTLVFKYKKGENSVLVVSKEDYDSCSDKNPIAKLDGGDSTFTFVRSGPFFFISGVAEDCNKGQKLIVVVLALRHRSVQPVPVSSPPPSLPPSSPTSTSHVPSPQPSIVPPSPSSVVLPPAHSPASSPPPSVPPSSPTSTSPVSSPQPSIIPPSPSPSSVVLPPAHSPVSSPPPSSSPSAPSPSSTPTSSPPSMSPAPASALVPGPSRALAPSTATSPSPSASPQAQPVAPVSALSPGTDSSSPSPSPSPPDKKSASSVITSPVVLLVLSMALGGLLL